MNLNIPFSGIAGIPSGRTAPDGQLTICHNAISIDGAIRPLGAPEQRLNVGLNATILLIHSVPQSDNLILLCDAPLPDSRIKVLKWCPKDAQSISGAATITKIPDILSATAIGNIIVLSTSAGLRYILWADGAYRYLGSAPSFPVIEFSLHPNGNLHAAHNDRALYIHYSAIYARHQGAAGYSPVESERPSDKVYGLLLKYVNETFVKKGLFYQPFFVRYAFRMFDGSYMWHSAPVLMLPCVHPPFVKVTNYPEKGLWPVDDDGYIYVKHELNSVRGFRLDYRFLNTATQIANIRNWENIIAGIDIFVSAPIYTFDQSKDFNTFSTFGRLAGAVAPESSDGGTDDAQLRPGANQPESSDGGTDDAQLRPGANQPESSDGPAHTSEPTEAPAGYSSHFLGHYEGTSATDRPGHVDQFLPNTDLNTECWDTPAPFDAARFLRSYTNLSSGYFINHIY